MTPTTSDEPVVDLCEARNPPFTAEETKRFNFLQRFSRSPLAIVFFILFALTIGSTPVMVMVPALFFLHWLGVLRHWPLRRFLDLCAGNWMTVMTFIFESAMGIKVRTFGFNGVMKKRCVIIMNHVTHLDWMFLWSLVDRQGDMSYWKPITKNMLRQIPVIGWCMQLSAHLFVNRKWEHDHPELCKKLYYLNGLDYPCQLLIFPEGGDLTPKTKKISDAFADKEGYPHYQYCIHPRTTGFVYAMNALRSGGLDAVYDVTIGYPDALPKTEVDFIKGAIPREIQFHIKSYDDKAIPEDDKELAQWCMDRWKEKEERLKNFYTHGKFHDGIETESNHSHQNNGVKNGVSNDVTNGIANGSHPDSNGKALYDSPEVFRQKNYWFLLYSVFIFIVTNAFVLFVVSLQGGLLYLMFGCGFLYYLSKHGGGLDYFFMGFHDEKTKEALAKSKKHRPPDSSSSN